MLFTKKRRSAILSGAIAGVLVLSSCGGEGSAGGEAGEINEITVATPSLPTSLDWGGAYEASLANFQARANLHVQLIRHPYTDNPAEPSMEVMDFTEYQGILADEDEPFSVSEDGTVYTFHLREDVVSQAGNPLTAEDVRWTFERKCETYTNGCWNQIQPYFPGPENIEVVDDHTIEFHVEDPDAGMPFLQFLSGQNGYIFDKTALEEHATEDDPYATDWAMNNSGYGFGPYDIESVTPDQQMVFTANPDFVLGEPEIEQVTWQVVEESGTRAQFLQAGNVDIADALTPEDQHAIADDDGVIIPEVEAPIELMNLGLVQNKEPFDDQLVRQAFRYAIPYDEILEDIYQGRATASPGWIIESMGVPGVSGEPAYTTDVDRARELLDEAGVDEVEFTMHVSNDTPDLANAAILMSSYVSEAGFNMEVQQVSAGDFATGRAEQDYQALIAMNRSQVQHPNHVIRSFFNPDNTANNTGAYDNPTEEFDELVSGAIAAGEPTEEESGERWAEVQEYLNEEASNLPVLYIQPNQGYSTDLEGFTYRYENVIDYGNVRPASG